MTQRDLFIAALQIDDPMERAAYLDQGCGDDQELRNRLDVHLAVHDQPASVLEHPVAGNLVGAAVATEPNDATAGSDGRAVEVEQTASHHHDATAPATPIGSVIAGRYKLREEIGEGGMGSVYLAQQMQPVKRQVALKVIKPGMDSTAVLARFESERQALALMNHPHIAKVFDAGTTEQGRPFFVMELVKGIPLTEYCDQHCLGLLERLALFRQICSAVQHAHQKGIIHRDLKPTNILVESHDGVPVPKVIDFGLAKATSGLQLSERSLFTAFGTVAGTPLYMAPEQAVFNALDVDTRADIYALGVILYELLTGSTPIRRETFRQAAFDEMLRLIREVEPPTPSSRISTSDTLPSIAATRQTEPARLSRFVRGDLDWIVMKALAKERNRRYESAIAMAQDIERFANHEPVTAGPPTATYRFKKFVRRNRPQVVAASLLLFALVGGIVGTSLGLFEARRQQRIAVAESLEKENARQAEAEQSVKAVTAEKFARKEADKALAINQFLTQDLLTQAEPANNAVEDKVTLLEVLDRAASKVGARFSDQHEVDIELRRTIAGTYHGLAAWEKAEAQWRTVMEAEKMINRQSAASYEAQSELCHIRRHRGRYDSETLAMAQEAADGLARTLGPDDPRTLNSMNNLAEGYRAAGKLDRALPILEETLARRKATLGPDHPEILNSMNNLALGYLDGRDLDRALPLLEETLALKRSTFGLDHPDTLTGMNNLAMGYRVANKLDRALPLFEEALTRRKSKLGLDHPNTIQSMDNLAGCYWASGKLDRALPLYEETFALRKSRLGPDHPDTPQTMNNLASAYWCANRLDQSIPLFEQCLKLMRVKLGEDHPDTIVLTANLGVNYKAAGRLPEALLLLEEANRAARKHARLRGVAKPLLDAYFQSGRNDDAAALARATLTDDRAALPAGSPQLAGTLAGTGLLLLKAKYWAEAETVLREALTIRDAKEPDDWKTFNTRSLLGAAILGQKNYAEAEAFLKAGYEGMKQRAEKMSPRDKDRLTEALDRLIELAEATGKVEDAKMWKDEKSKLADGPTPKTDPEKK